MLGCDSGVVGDDDGLPLSGALLRVREGRIVTLIHSLTHSLLAATAARCATLMAATATVSTATPQQVRGLCRAGGFSGATCGLAPGHAQANLVVLPRGEVR